MLIRFVGRLRVTAVMLENHLLKNRNFYGLVSSGLAGPTVYREVVGSNPTKTAKNCCFNISNIMECCDNGSRLGWKPGVPAMVLQVRVLYIPQALLGRFSKLNKTPISHIL